MKKPEFKILSSIRARVGLSYLLIILLPFLVVGLIANGFMRDSALKKETETLLNNVSSTELYINEILGIAEQYYYLFATDEDMIKSAQAIVNPDNINAFEDIETIRKIYISMQNYVKSAPHINSIYFYNSYTKAFYLSSKEDFMPQIMTQSSDDIAFNLNRKEIEKSLWYTNYKLQGVTQTWYLTNDIKPENHDIPILAFCTSLKFGQDDYEEILSINIKESKISDILDNITTDNTAVISIINRNGQIISSTDHNLLSSYVLDTDYNNIFDDTISYKASHTSEITVEGNKYLLLGYYSQKHDWIYLVQTPYDSVVSAANQSKIMLILLYTIIAMLVIISLYFTMPLFYSPLETLITGLKKVETGDFSTRMPENREDEYGYIFKQFNRTTASIQDLIEENYSIAIEKNSITMKYIQSQINKHFLFNTLNIINWKVREGDTALGADAIVTLSNFFRLSLNYGEDFLTVNEVCTMLKYYADLIELRYPEKYDIQINFDNDVADIPVLKIIFQPLLENSLQHGLGKNKGKITVDFIRKDDHVLFTLEDNGKGMSVKKINEIMKSFDNPLEKHENFALKSINRLLKLVYKDRYDFKIKSKPNHGTTIEIYMPLN